MSSFIKDPDRHTRGVNAIAAVDGVGNRLRRLEARKALAMRRRDAALATVASRAFRTSTLGAIPTTGIGKQFTQGINTSLTSYNRPDMPTGGSTWTTPPRPRPIPGSGTTVPTLWPRPTLMNPGVSQGLVAQPKGVNLTGGGTWTGPVVVGPGGGTVVGGGGVSPTVNPITGSSSGGSVSGGGGGGGGMVTDPGPDGFGPNDGGSLVDDGAPVVPEDTSSNKKYLLYAALAIGAYWLWRRSKKGT